MSQYDYLRALGMSVFVARKQLEGAGAHRVYASVGRASSTGHRQPGQATAATVQAVSARRISRPAPVGSNRASDAGLARTSSHGDEHGNAPGKASRGAGRVSFRWLLWSTGKIAFMANVPGSDTDARCNAFVVAIATLFALIDKAAREQLQPHVLEWPPSKIGGLSMEPDRARVYVQEELGVRLVGCEQLLVFDLGVDEYAAEWIKTASPGGCAFGHLHCGLEAALAGGQSRAALWRSLQEHVPVPEGWL